MTAKQAILKQFQSGAFSLLTAEAVAQKLRLGHRESLAVRNYLRALVREGELLSDSRGRFGTAAQFSAVRGTVTGNERGFAFFAPDDGSKDLFLPHASLRGAMHGDTVLAFCVGGPRDDEGEVLAVLGHGCKEVVGTYHSYGRAGYLDPDEKRIGTSILIPAGKAAGCRDGIKAVAAIDSYGETPTGHILLRLGPSGERSVEENAILRGRSLREDFPQEAISEAERAARRPIERELPGRLDLRQRLIFTVDGEDTRDIDDAISVEKRGGVYELGVHIADVSRYVARNRALDREAYLRGTSVYFPDRVLPMLPPVLSNGVCSLNEGEDRLTLSCLMTVDGSGRVLRYEIRPSVIRSSHRMTYPEITGLCAGDEALCRRYPDLIGPVGIAMELTNILKRARKARGAVDLDAKEPHILYRDGEIIVTEERDLSARGMIEEFMILANESVARFVTERGAPFLYRVHERPSEDKAEDLAAFLQRLGLPAPFSADAVSPSDYRSVLEAAQAASLGSIVSRVMLRSMMKAVYSPVNIGHFGLASECYCHFTSPIRRYPDLVVHRILHAILTRGEGPESYRSFVKEAAARASACERNALEAEREVDALYLCYYMEKHLGETFPAVLSGITSFGLFAELENAVEGFIPPDLLPEGTYEYDEIGRTLRGTRRSFRLGQAVTVKAVGVDLGARRVRFALL